MKTYTYTEARQNLAKLLAEAKDEDVLIERRNGERFILRRQEQETSPLDVPGISTGATTADIVAAVRESRRRKT